MAQAIKNGVYKCGVCGNIVEMIGVGGGELVCCGKPMELFEEKSVEEGSEKHKPVLKRIEDGFNVDVGSIPHPMEENHRIMWIELIVEGKIYRQDLEIGRLPHAKFLLSKETLLKIDQSKNIMVRAYCNVHGLWKS